MNTKRTQQEIVERIRRMEEDFFGIQTVDLLPYLSFELAKEFIKPATTAEEWVELKTAADIDPVGYIKDYMNFAWNKALGERGISAGRSIDHMCAWLWLAGEDDLLEFAENDRNYAPYGKPILKRICEHYGLPIPENGENNG